jgi:type I restriction enzyme S subunit
MINKEWEWCPIGDLFEIGAGKTMSAAARNGANKVPFLRTANVFWDEIDLTEVDKMSISADELADKSLRPGDLLVCEGGDIGRAAIWNGEVEVMSFQNHIHRLRPRTHNVVARFYVYFLQCAFTQLGIFEGAGNKTTIPNLSRNRLSGLEVPCPPLLEQQAITLALAQVRSALKASVRAGGIVHELKGSAMRELFTRGLRGEPQKETKLGLMPRSWGVSSLASVAAIERGRFTHRPRNDPRFYGGATPFVQTGDVVRSGGRIREFSQTLNAEGLQVSRLFPAGTILITIAANIGYSGILCFESACPDSIVAITPNSDVDTLFLEYFLQTQQREMDRRAPKGTQKNINIEFLKPWLVPLPSVEEQREIAEILETVDRTIDLHQRKRVVLEELFKSLLHKLMTGEIRVSDLDLSPLHPAAIPGGVA